jgi:NAD-dependent dihydropyrimidine dehydrogenase PreA subunit
MRFRYFTSALALELDLARCVGCGRCVEVCPHDVFALVRAASRGTTPSSSAPAPRLQSSIVDRDRCMECGACALNCAAGAIHAGSGVGCATAIINGMIRGTAPECGCGCGGANSNADGCNAASACGGEN